MLRVLSTRDELDNTVYDNDIMLFIIFFIFNFLLRLPHQTYGYISNSNNHIA